MSFKQVGSDILTNSNIILVLKNVELAEKQKIEYVPTEPWRENLRRSVGEGGM